MVLRKNNHSFIITQPTRNSGVRSHQNLSALITYQLLYRLAFEFYECLTGSVVLPPASVSDYIPG